MKFQRLSGNMRFVCHPELRSGMGVYKERETISRKVIGDVWKTEVALLCT